MIVEPLKGADLVDANLIDHAVQMQQFDNKNLLTTLVGGQKLSLQIWAKLAQAVVSFHASAEVFGDDEYGNPTLVNSAVEQNFVLFILKLVCYFGDFRQTNPGPGPAGNHNQLPQFPDISSLF